MAHGEYLVLLNNDAVVTDGWLDQLIALANMKTDQTTAHTEITEEKTGEGERRRDGRAEKIGLVGSMSDYAAPPQLVE